MESPDLPLALKELLLSEPMPDGNPMFHSGRDIGRVIAGIEYFEDGKRNHYFEKAASAANSLNQCIRDDRPMNRKLRDALLEAVRIQLRELSAEDRSYWVGLTAKAIVNVGQQNPATVGRMRHTESALVELLVDRAKSAKEIALVYTGIHGVPDLNMFRHLLFDGLQLSEPGEYTAESPRTRFTIIENELDFALEGWRRTYYQLVGIGGTDPYFKPLLDANEAAKRLNLVDNEGYFRNYIVAPEVANLPIVAIDPMDESASIVAVAFVLGDAGGNYAVQAFEVPKLYANHWRQYVYEPIIHEKLAGRRVRFSEVEEEVVPEARMRLRQ